MEKERQIESLRAFCTIAVVLLHVSGVCVSSYSEGMSPTMQHALACCNIWTRFAVPIFIMITGYLLLRPEKAVDFKKAICKYVWRMVVVLLTVGFAYAWMEIAFTEETIRIQQIPKAYYDVLTGNIWDHMWYLYMLIGLYLVIPILKPFINQSSTRAVDILLIILGLFCIVLPTIANYTDFRIGVRYPMQSSCLFYLILGYRMGVLKNEKSTTVTAALLSLVVIMTTLICVFVSSHSTDTGWQRKHLTLDSPIIVLLCIGIFLLFKRLHKDGRNTSQVNRLWFGIAKCSFGIYIFHPFWMNLIHKFLHFNPMEWGICSVFVMIVTVIVLSWGTTWLFRKIPFIG